MRWEGRKMKRSEEKKEDNGEEGQKLRIKRCIESKKKKETGW